MQWAKLIDVLKNNKLAFTIWLAANVGGLIIAYSAIVIIILFLKPQSNYYPGPHEYLIVAAISVAISGVSYTNLYKVSNTILNPWFIYIWPILLFLIFGILIGFGGKSAPYENLFTWGVAVGIFVVGLLWSSITWLHEQGIRSDMSNPKIPKTTPPKDLFEAAKTLPKVRATYQRKGK
jgi:hypothetical protein